MVPTVPVLYQGMVFPKKEAKKARRECATTAAADTHCSNSQEIRMYIASYIGTSRYHTVVECLEKLQAASSKSSHRIGFTDPTYLRTVRNYTSTRTSSRQAKFNQVITRANYVENVPPLRAKFLQILHVEGGRLGQPHSAKKYSYYEYCFGTVRWYIRVLHSK